MLNISLPSCIAAGRGPDRAASYCFFGIPSRVLAPRVICASLQPGSEARASAGQPRYPGVLAGCGGASADMPTPADISPPLRPGTRPRSKRRASTTQSQPCPAGNNQTPKTSSLRSITSAEGSQQTPRLCGRDRDRSWVPMLGERQLRSVPANTGRMTKRPGKLLDVPISTYLIVLAKMRDRGEHPGRRQQRVGL
jgi:hypothetical protein